MEPTPGELLKSSGDVIEKNWMFCPISGSLLILDTAGGMARSELAIFERPLSDLDDTMNVVRCRVLRPRCNVGCAARLVIGLRRAVVRLQQRARLPATSPAA